MLWPAPGQAAHWYWGEKKTGTNTVIKTLQLNNQSSMWQKDVKGLRCQCQICCQLSGLDCDVRCAQVDGELQLKKKKKGKHEWIFQTKKHKALHLKLTKTWLVANCTDAVSYWRKETSKCIKVYNTIHQFVLFESVFDADSPPSFDFHVSSP